jgi:hypothetical protein
LFAGCKFGEVIKFVFLGVFSRDFFAFDASANLKRLSDDEVRLLDARFEEIMHKIVFGKTGENA